MRTLQLVFHGEASAGWFLKSTSTRMPVSEVLIFAGGFALVDYGTPGLPPSMERHTST